MKTYFIPVKYKKELTNLFKKVNLKGKIGLVSTVQYLDQLEKANKIIKNSVVLGQVLGCNVNNVVNKKVDCILFIGSAYFHPIEIAVKSGKPTYILNPLTKKISKVSEKEVNEYKRKIKGKQLRYLHAKNKAVLVCVKPGQNNLEKALKLKYPVFLFNNLDEHELENFLSVDVFINTACYRIDNKKVINLEDLPK
ncbi:MAG: diphthamide synthesis protein [Nanoarchaeota archaeon]|nr:diphthamide synthesis protein [Nanoarchaeota archaeon]